MENILNMVFDRNNRAFYNNDVYVKEKSLSYSESYS